MITMYIFYPLSLTSLNYEKKNGNLIMEIESPSYLYERHCRRFYYLKYYCKYVLIQYLVETQTKRNFDSILTVLIRKYVL